MYTYAYDILLVQWLRVCMTHAEANYYAYYRNLDANLFVTTF